MGQWAELPAYSDPAHDGVTEVTSSRDRITASDLPKLRGGEVPDFLALRPGCSGPSNENDRIRAGSVGHFAPPVDRG